MSQPGRNIKFALRQLWKSPGFTIVAVLIFALGIGANTAIFSVVNGVLLEPLPFRNPDRLVQLWHTPPQSSFPGITRFALSAANFLDWQKQNHVFEEMTLYTFRGFDLSGTGKPESLRSGAVTSSFFSVLGVQPLYGRVFTADEDQPGRNHVAILTYRYWKQHYGADPGVIGRTINLDGTAYQIVGVMGPRMTRPDFAQIWTPLGLTPQEAAVRGEHHYLAMARLKPGVTLAQAQNEMNTISHRLEVQYPADDKGWGAEVISLRDSLVGDVRPALLMMLGAVGFVLLIACANVANLMLGRAFARRKEIAIRTALGASRAGVIRLLVVECLIVALAGGALGLYTAHFGIDLLIKFFADKLPRMGDIGLNRTVLLFALALSIVTGLLSGLLPGIALTRGDINEALKQGLGRTDADAGSGLTRSALVTIEVALSLVLLVGAGLMVRSLWKLQATDPGFDVHNVLTASLEVPRKQFTAPEQETQFLSSALERIRAVPGVESAATIDDLPLEGGSNQPVAISGRPVQPMSEQPEVSVRVVSPDYFQTMKIPILAGRDFTWGDKPDAAAVVVISKSMANQFWPHDNPIGQHLKLTFFPDRERTVVGVVGDVKQNGLDTTSGIATLYWPAAQVGAGFDGPWRPYGLSLAIRTSVPPLTLTKAISSAVAQVNGSIPVDNVLTLEDLVGGTLTQNKFNMELLAIFGGLAVLLCSIGIYSVLAYSVRRRIRDIGLRLAFGASLSDVARLVILEGMKPTLAGIALGLLGAFAMGRVVSSLIYGISARDLTTFLCVTVLLVLIAFTASLLPALRATRIDPLTVLRDE
ncbi:MAG TPA: ABC transporter permease [Acidobacteriaceae bacterium]|nr:ABC transporter permease [Acidobacteriaceae bacterium]